MSNELSLIAIRIREVQQEIDRLEDRMGELEEELEELDSAGKVVARLSGAQWPPASETNASEQASASGARPKGIPNTPDMIVAVLKDQLPGVSMSPKDIQDEIGRRWWKDVKSDLVGPTIWRMWKQNRLERAGDGLYRLPQKHKAVDDDPGGDPSTALFE